eukprot:m.22137 g.22137  ORF g.22137 m.22137 type:complete len:410 (+) comp5766_c0_seq1:92-1321(+)
MSLYDGLGLGLDAPPVPEKEKAEAADAAKKGDGKKDGESGAKWNVNLQMMAPHLRRKRAADVAAKAAALRAKAKARTTSSGASVTQTVVKKASTVKATPVAQTAAPAAEPFLPLSTPMEIKDEYNPAMPNDYEMWKHIIGKENEASGESNRKKEDSHRKSGAAIAPPPSLVGDVVKSGAAIPPPYGQMFSSSSSNGSGLGFGGAKAERTGAASTPDDDADFQDPFANLPVTGYMGGSDSSSSGAAASAASQPSSGLAMSGEDAWNARARKSGRPESSAGAAIPPPPPAAAAAPPPPPSKPGQSGPVLYRQAPAEKVAASTSAPSCTVLLKNLVGPGEVDADLEPEIAEECSKFGTVVKTSVKELQGVAPNEAVQVYVQFARQEAATKAISAMNGRYFGGRIVMADYHST